VSADSDRIGRPCLCYFTPIVGSQQDYEDFFKSENFDTYTDIVIRVKEGSVRFATRAEADLFLDHFHNIQFKGQKMKVEKTRPLPSPVKTLHLSGFTPGRLTERAIYNRMLEFGFLRRVAIKRDFAFVEFDTIEEAARVARQFRFLDIGGETVRVAFSRSEPKAETRLTIPLKELVPLSHPFWFQLQDRLYEAGNHFQ
jgi:RNA recognition motif-containing protein